MVRIGIAHLATDRDILWMGVLIQILLNCFAQCILDEIYKLFVIKSTTKLVHP
jgi:hypothetical protein